MDAIKRQAYMRCVRRAFGPTYPESACPMLFSECWICHAATQKHVIWLLKERFSLACSRLQDNGENWSQKSAKNRVRAGEREWHLPSRRFSLTHVFAALVLLSLLIRFFRSCTMTESLAQARFSFDRVYVDHRLNMLCANTGRQDSCERIFKKYTHDSLSGGRQT